MPHPCITTSHPYPHESLFNANVCPECVLNVACRLQRERHNSWIFNCWDVACPFVWPKPIFMTAGASGYVCLFLAASVFLFICITPILLAAGAFVFVRNLSSLPQVFFLCLCAHNRSSWPQVLLFCLPNLCRRRFVFVCIKPILLAAVAFVFVGNRLSLPLVFYPP